MLKWIYLFTLCDFLLFKYSPLENSLYKNLLFVWHFLVCKSSSSDLTDWTNCYRLTYFSLSDPALRSLTTSSTYLLPDTLFRSDLTCFDLWHQQKHLKLILYTKTIINKNVYTVVQMIQMFVHWYCFGTSLTGNV